MTIWNMRGFILPGLVLVVIAHWNGEALLNKDLLLAQRQKTLELTQAGPPQRTSNPFFGVGPITDGALNEDDSKKIRRDFEHWIGNSYRKLDDQGRDIGPFTIAELSRSMHRGYPADKVILDMMREIHRYFAFPKTNRMAVGLGGGHSGFTVCALHLITAASAEQHIFIDTPEPESETAKSGGFFRQSWGAQLVELMRLSKGGDESRLHFARHEGQIPNAETLKKMGVKLFFGVGHETTGATTYSQSDITNLLSWLDENPTEHHAVLDATSMLGAMPWDDEIIKAVLAKCCLFSPFQKAIGGISGYYIASFTPAALAFIEANQRAPGFAIPRQLKLATPLDARKPLTGQRSTNIGPFYDPQADKMLGGVINTFSTLAFAETTFGLLRLEKNLGDMMNLNHRSRGNRQTIDDWIANTELLELGVADAERRGTAVTLLKIKDPDIKDPELHARILQRSKQLLSYDGITHPNGEHEKGLDVARYINAFPGTPGDYRAWIGGIRPTADVIALLENLRYAYLRAKILVFEEELVKQDIIFPAPALDRAYKVLICDLIGLKFSTDGKPDLTEVKTHIEARGGIFHFGAAQDSKIYETAKIHFFYLPEISTEAEILPLTDKGHYDAVIAAATFLPKASIFKSGGVRIGAGTGNMGSASWGTGNGVGGDAPLMNTPGFNSRVTAQMAFKALVRMQPGLPINELHRRSVAGEFDSGKHLHDFPAEKLEGKTIAILGYGNIGREVAKLAHAFGLIVKVYARSHHQARIEADGFVYSSTAIDAATQADVLSVHTGLGTPDAATKQFTNAGIINAEILNVMNSNSVLLNYDRGECVDVAALDAAMASGKISHAAIDADIFKSPNGTLTGPLVPYLPLAKKYPGRVELLPHAAADTDHPSRVAGAKQAVDQIFDCILHKRVTNLIGDLPPGYVNAGMKLGTAN